MWLDGTSAGNHKWQTQGYREWDKNNKPEEIADLSFERRWFSEKENNGYEIFTPKKLPIQLPMPLGFCDAGSVHKLVLKGKWKPPLADSTPQVVFRINKTHELFHWELKEGDKTKGPHEYHVWAKEKKVQRPSSIVKLSKMDLDMNTSPDFNLTITCINFNSTGQFKVELNSWDPSKGMPRDEEDWDIEADMNTTLVPDNVTAIDILGNMEVEYAGFTMSGCLALAPNGLVVEMKGDDCTKQLDGVCEHQSCYTVEGHECVFPFDYKGVTVHNCTSVDVYQPWCATG